MVFHLLDDRAGELGDLCGQLLFQQRVLVCADLTGSGEERLEKLGLGAVWRWRDIVSSIVWLAIVVTLIGNRISPLPLFPPAFRSGLSHDDIRGTPRLG